MNNLFLELSEKELRDIYGGETNEKSEKGDIVKYWENKEDGIHTGWEHR